MSSEVQRLQPAIYKFGGLRIASSFPLYGLHLCRDETEAPAEVVIRCAPIPEGMTSSTTRIIDGHYSGTYNGRDLLLDFRGAGRFLLRGGEEILVEPAPSSDDDYVRALLLGVVFGILCHQRGIAPLHASAIDVADGCIAFVGPSGAGKSTTVAALAQRGHEIIADDECFLQLSTAGDVQAWPGISGRTRLWKDSMTALGFDGGPGLEREMQGYDKYLIPLPAPRNPTQLRPLRRVYQLCRVSNGVTELTRLRGGDALEVLLQNIYPSKIPALLGYQSHVFTVCAAAALDVPIFRLSQPLDLNTIDQSTELLDRHLQDSL